MVDFVANTSTIGADGGRDFSTFAAYKVTLPNPFVNETFEGVLFADSDFDEMNLDISTPNAGDPASFIVRAAVGELPVFKPASGSGGNIILIGNRGQQSIVGITVDGANLTGNINGFFSDNDANNFVVGCVAKNMPGTGVGFLSSSQHLIRVFCLAANCGGDGFNNTNSAGPIIGCGAVGCATGFKSGNVAKPLLLTACWSLDNTTDIDAASVTLRRFLYISDASIADADDVFINQVPANLGFENFAGGDYRLKIGSVLIAKGFPFWNRGQAAAPVIPLVDAFGGTILVTYGLRMNIGPSQPRAVSADFPAVGDVESGVSYDDGNLIGTFGVPTEAQVLLSVGYGEDDTEFTGSLGNIIPPNKITDLRKA